MADLDHLLNTLNPAQLQAVSTTDGPVMVLAGPGTGKTQVLAARITYILSQTDTNPSSILVLTFTDSAAKNMRQRLISMIGKTAYYVQIHTFHSFCQDVINDHPEYFPIDRDAQPLTELERFSFFEKIIESEALNVLKPINTPFYYLKDMIKALSDLKREGVTPARLAELVADEEAWLAANQDELKKTELTKIQKRIAKNTDLIKIYQAYQQRLQQHQRYDFDDMILLCSQALSTHSELLLEYQEKILYLMVDEYQDTNTAQNQIVDQLASYWGESANVCVVGDPHQSIFRFQGASIENVLSFTERYPQAAVITLTTGYRSSQLMYDAAAHLISHNHLPEQAADMVSPVLGAQAQALQSVKTESAPIYLYSAPSQTLEAVYVANEVDGLIKSGVDPSQIAILYRNNFDAVEFMTALDKWGIRYDIDTGRNVLEVPHIQLLLDLMRVIVGISGGQDRPELYRVLMAEWWGLPPVLVMSLAKAAAKSKLSIWELMTQGYSVFHQHASSAPVSELEWQLLDQIKAKLLEWASHSAQLTTTGLFEKIITYSGYLAWIQRSDSKVEYLHQLNSLYRELTGQVATQPRLTLAEFLTQIDTYQAHGLSVALEDLNITEQAVRLSTVHKAKGQEWEYVFLVRLNDGKWGNSRQVELLPLPPAILRHTDLSTKERNEDDRRLYYVGLTRAKTQLTITYPESTITDNRTKANLPSVFLEEIKEFLTPVSAEKSEAVINQADQHLSTLLSPAPVAVSVSERQFLASLVKDLKLSVTMLNDYLRDPQIFVERHLLRVPSAKTPQLVFGTAVHYALEKWFRSYQHTQQHPSLEVVLAAFAECLQREELTEREYADRHRYGQEVLSKYYAQVAAQPLIRPPLFIEKFFGSGRQALLLGDIQLQGKIDRIDWIDVASKTACVVDYKTGRARTIGELTGQTQVAQQELSARELALPDTLRTPFQRQLLFYKLLTDLDPSFVPRVTHGLFEFVVPDNSTGKFVKREWELTDSAVTQLKELIIEVGGEIRKLGWLGDE